MCITHRRQKTACLPQNHHYMCKKPMKNGRLHLVPVGLGASEPTDFCLYCRKSRVELEGVPA